MGNYASKLLSYTNESQNECSDQAVVQQAAVQQAAAEDNKMCTPRLLEKRVLGDPRSISAGIRRTPIEVKCNLAGVNKNTPSAIPKYLQKKQYLETDMDAVMPPLTPKKRPIPKSVDSDKSESSEVQNYLTPNVSIVKKQEVITATDEERFIVLGLDPRSPAADFDRTPILMPKSLALIKARSQEYLSRRGSYETDIYNSNNSRQEIGASLSIPDIQLISDTSTETPKTLDMEKQDELPSTSQYDSDLSLFKSEQEITVIKNPKYTDGEKESLTSDERTVAIDNEEDETDKDDDKNTECNTKIRDDNKIKLWHDSLSTEESVSGKEDEKELPREKASRQDVIITFDNYTTASTSLNSIKTKADFRMKADVKGRKKKNTKVDAKFNEEKVFSPEDKLGETEVHENRTPLGNRSNNGQMPRQLLRNKAAIRTTMMQQENTPPQMFTGKTRNGNQWDPNSTVLI